MYTVANIGIYLLFGAFALSILPESPFSMVTGLLTNIPYLDVLNWFVPVSEMVAIGQAWLAAIAVFYLVQMLLRWMNIVG